MATNQFNVEFKLLTPLSKDLKEEFLRI